MTKSESPKNMPMEGGNMVEDKEYYERTLEIHKMLEETSSGVKVLMTKVENVDKNVGYLKDDIKETKSDVKDLQKRLITCKDDEMGHRTKFDQRLRDLEGAKKVDEQMEKEKEKFYKRHPYITIGGVGFGGGVSLFGVIFTILKIIAWIMTTWRNW